MWGRISTLTTPVRKRYQLDTCCLLNSNEHAFIYLFSNKMICTNFITYFGIKWYFSVKLNLKRPLSRGSQFKSHLYLRWQGNRGSSQSFHATSFSRDYRSIIPKHEAFNMDEMHSNINTTKKIKMTKLRVMRYVCHEIINKLSPFIKSKI